MEPTLRWTFPVPEKSEFPKLVFAISSVKSPILNHRPPIDNASKLNIFEIPAEESRNVAATGIRKQWDSRYYCTLSLVKWHLIWPAVTY
jgi:hypothetical protein